MPEPAKTRSKTPGEWVTDLTAGLRLPWQRPAPDGRLTPARVRRGFRNIRANLPCPAQCAETRQTRPRTPARLNEPPPGPASQRGQTEKKTAAKKNLTKQTG